MSDVFVALQQKEYLEDLTIEPPLYTADDPRRRNIVAVLATSAPADDKLVQTARKHGVWLLDADGSGFRLLES